MKISVHCYLYGNQFFNLYSNMKKILLAGLVCFASVGFVACSNGDYDANPNTNNGNVTNPLNNNGGGNNGGGNNGGNSSFNWSGTDPLSAKTDGEAWVANDASTFDLNGYTIIDGSLENTSNDKTVMISIKSSIVEAGKTYSVSATSADVVITYTEYIDGPTLYTAASGEVRIDENDATHVKGKFYFTGKDPFTSTSKNVTEGYFNINKE